MRLLILYALSLLGGCAIEQERYLEITAPSDQALLEADQTVTVTGIGKGLFENSVVLNVEDTEGKRLQQLVTTLTVPEIGSEGSWQQHFSLQPGITAIKLIATSPSSIETQESVTSRPVFLTVHDSISNELERTSWRLVQLIAAKGEEKPVKGDSQIDMTFADNKLSGHSGCNNYFGGYQTTQTRLLSLTGPISSTLRSCDSQLNEQEHNYLKLLAKATRYRLDHGNLVLLDSDQNPVLKFKPKKALASLVGTKWRAVGINNGQGGVVNDNNTHLSTAQFEDGEIKGNAGCNQFSASYTEHGRQIMIGPARTTRKACSEEGIMEQENQFLDALGRVSYYEITAERLSLRDQKGVLWVSFEKFKP
ncbi:MAG: META domain-containing protein [Gammaproteobacteria bacterium]